MDDISKIPYDHDEIQAPTKGWKVGDLARATSTKEEGRVVKVEWQHITNVDGGRRLKFHIRFIERIEDE